jgi:hypothetical protein
MSANASNGGHINTMTRTRTDTCTNTSTTSCEQMRGNARCGWTAEYPVRSWPARSLNHWKTKQALSRSRKTGPRATRYTPAHEDTTAR